MKEETQKSERKCSPITCREETINTRKIRRNPPLNSPWSHAYQRTRWRENEESWSKWLKNCIGKIRNAVKASVHRAPFSGTHRPRNWHVESKLNDHHIMKVSVQSIKYQLHRPTRTSSTSLRTESTSYVWKNIQGADVRRHPIVRLSLELQPLHLKGINDFGGQLFWTGQSFNHTSTYSLAYTALRLHAWGNTPAFGTLHRTRAHSSERITLHVSFNRPLSHAAKPGGSYS